MVLALALEEAKVNQTRLEGREGKEAKGGVTLTPFFGSPASPDIPHANLAQRDARRVSPAHFHMRDQFQVIVDGKGTLGRHNLAPYCVHFSRAYTPYGPLASDAGTGLGFFVMRAHYDPGSQDLPESEATLKQVPDRRPWQISRQASFPTLQATATGVVLQAIPDIKDEQGLAAYTLSMKPNATAFAPDPSHGDGQYLVVVNGSLLHDNKEYKAWALVFIGPKEGAFQIHAGSGGLEALVLNFPRPRTNTTREAASKQTTPGYKRWQCALCSFVYDEAAGLPEEGIASGTRWQDVSETWTCPDCSASKADFQMIELKA